MYAFDVVCMCCELFVTHWIDARLPFDMENVHSLSHCVGKFGFSMTSRESV